MKPFLIFFALLIISCSSYGQGIEVVSSLSTSKNIALQGAKGVGINYQFLQIDSALGKKSIQLGVGVLYSSINLKDYSAGEFLMPPTVIIPHINTQIQKTCVRLNALMVLRDNKYMMWAIGPELSYNIFYEHGDRQDYYSYPGGGYISSSYSFNQTVQTIGLGLLTKIEIRNIFTPKLSLTFNIKPEFMYNFQTINQQEHGVSSYGDLGLFGFTNYLEIQLGLKYNFNTIK